MPAPRRTRSPGVTTGSGVTGQQLQGKHPDAEVDRQRGDQARDHHREQHRAVVADHVDALVDLVEDRPGAAGTLRDVSADGARIKTGGIGRVEKAFFFNRPMDPALVNGAYGVAGDQRNRGPGLAAKFGAAGALIRELGRKDSALRQAFDAELLLLQLPGRPPVPSSPRVTVLPAEATPEQLARMAESVKKNR